MSRTADALKRPILKEDVLDTHIANTYFYQKSRAKIRKKKTRPSLQNLAKLFIALSLTAIMLLALAITTPIVHTRYLSILKDKTLNSKIITLVNKGSVNHSVIKTLEYGGYARKTGDKNIKNAIAVSNSKKYNWADIALNFRFPVDLSDRSVLISMKGGSGGEKISIILRDVNNKSYRLNDISLSSKWSDKTLKLNGIKNNLDLARISHMRIECGLIGDSVKDMDSPINTTIYIRNIELTKEA